MLQKIYDWIDERIDITPIWRDVADHEVPEHVNPAHHFSAFVYCFGGLTFFVLVIQILSGMFLTMFYVPDIENAWQSVYYLQTEVAHGQIVRGMHHWGASVLIRSEEHTSELQSRGHLVCRLLLEKKNKEKQ